MVRHPTHVNAIRGKSLSEVAKKRNKWLVQHTEWGTSITAEKLYILADGRCSLYIFYAIIDYKRRCFINEKS